ncbi:Hypothetical protein R9X50_00155800 [Acrodontium crateriforme]|uniref:Aminoglycoside phosphotransferase domain-containing protein n=1 Tax=Acrodontium crateriforme TaxID=150365 RepID=A0AAQ3LZI3_9PEZI|nr:Hypothetical protein R9X50_00155800 [Acrodontium crateriforme]
MSSSTRPNDDSAAAQYNRRVLNKLQNAFKRQPDIDLIKQLPSVYRNKLSSKKQGDAQRSNAVKPTLEDQVSPTSGVLPLTIDVARSASVLYPLSDDVEMLLNQKEPQWRKDGALLSNALNQVVRFATVLFQSTSDVNHFVARCSDGIVLKAISQPDSTEYDTLQFLEEKTPAFPKPKPHGVINIGDIWYMFMSFIPGVSLDKIWETLGHHQKRSISDDLENIISHLRRIPHQNGKMLGGVAGQGCKDTRRHTRTAKDLYTCEDVWKFMYGSARCKDTIYGKFLQQQTFPPRDQRIVFIHGDLRPANIIVQISADESLKVTGLIDWEMSGFYPEDLECVKAMNNLSPLGTDDWYLYLPSCISPRNHLKSWHTDCVWDQYIV